MPRGHLIETLYLSTDTALGKHCATATGSRLISLGTGDAGALDQADIAAHAAEWASFLDTHNAQTRYNAPRRFADGLAMLRPDQPQPLCVMLYADRLLAIMVGNLSAGDAWRGLGGLSAKLPGLNTLVIEQGCIVTNGSRDAADAVAAHLAGLLKEGCLQRVELKNLDVESALHRAFSTPKTMGLRAQRVSHVRYLRRLRDSATDAPIQTNSAKTRQGLRRKQRALEKQLDGALDLEIVTRPDQTDEFTQDAHTIVLQTYQSALQVGVHDDPATRAYLKTLAEEDTLRAYIYRSGDQPIAYVLGDVANGAFQLWATSYLPAYARLSPGILLLNQSFDALTEEGVAIFDFGHGDAEYKRRLGNEERREEDICMYGPQMMPRIAFAAHSGSDTVRAFVRNGLIRFGLLDRLRKYWRAALQRSGRR